MNFFSRTRPADSPQTLSTARDSRSTENPVLGRIAPRAFWNTVRKSFARTDTSPRLVRTVNVAGGASGGQFTPGPAVPVVSTSPESVINWTRAPASGVVDLEDVTIPARPVTVHELLVTDVQGLPTLYLQMHTGELRLTEPTTGKLVGVGCRDAESGAFDLPQLPAPEAFDDAKAAVDDITTKVTMLESQMRDLRGQEKAGVPKP